MEASTVSQPCCTTPTINGERNKKFTAGLDLLPDEILIAIVSKLTTLKEAVSTSVISTRWRYLWQFTSGTFDFHERYASKLGQFTLETIDSDDEGDSTSWIQGNNFQRWVDHILKLHQSPSIDNLSLFVPMMWGSGSFDVIDRCISYAMQKEVVTLDIDVSCISYYSLHLRKFLYICREVSSETLLCRLISVRLVHVEVDGEMINYLISNGPRIENVSLESIDCSFTNLEAVGSSLRSLKISYCSVLRSLKVFCPSLKSLEIWGCLKFKSLEIGAENLVSFNYGGPRFRRKRFRDVSILSELQIGGDFCRTFLSEPNELCKYSGWLKMIEKLKLCVSLEDTRKFLNASSISGRSRPLHNLKQLELQIMVNAGDSFMVFPAFMKGCPFLSKLVIKLSYVLLGGLQVANVMDDYKSEVGNGAGFEHEGLKVVEIINFSGLRMDLVLALQLVLLAPRLEKMIIRLSSFPLGDLSRTRTHAEQLQADVPPNVELVIL